MQRILRSTLISLLALALVTGCSAQPKEEVKLTQPKQVKEFVATKNTQILQAVDLNLLGDESPEKVVLYSEPNDSGMPVSFSLVVNNIEKVKLGSEDGLYSIAAVKFEDIDGDKNPEVLLYRSSTGSSGARGLNIYKPGEGDWPQLFGVANPMYTDDDQRFKVKYIGDYYASFEDQETGLKTTIPLAKERYNGIEDMLKGIATWIDPIAEYSLVDHDGDGKEEIITIQRVIGVAHADTIALLKTTYKLAGDGYQAVTLTLCDDKDKPLAEVKL